MFSSEVRSLIRYFNQYNKIPLAMHGHYVQSCLNQDRRRQVHPHIDNVLYIDKKGVCAKATKNEVGCIVYFSPV